MGRQVKVPLHLKPEVLTHSSSSKGQDHQHTVQLRSGQVSPPSSPYSREGSSEEKGSSVNNSDVLSLHPNRDKGNRQWTSEVPSQRRC